MKKQKLSENDYYNEEKKIRALVCGHTGATGKALMKALIESPQVETIIAVGRRENPYFNKNSKVKQHIVPNMLDINKVDIKIAENCNVAFCTIGTPFNDVAKKSKQDSYRAVDFGITTEFAKFAKSSGVEFFATITGEGTENANEKSANMFRVKKDVEVFIQSLGFNRVAIMRPGFLDRGKDAGFVERLMLPGIFGTPVSKIANSMIWASITQNGKVVGYNTKEIKVAAEKFEDYFKN